MQKQKLHICKFFCDFLPPNPCIYHKKSSIFAADFENKRIMTDVRLPKITLTVEAKPWPANHVARVTSFRPVSTRVRQPRIIEAQVLAQ